MIGILPPNFLRLKSQKEITIPQDTCTNNAIRSVVSVVGLIFMYVWVGVGFPTQIQYLNLSEWWLKYSSGEGQPSESMYYFQRSILHRQR